jgi:hypothetical protein
MMFRSSDDVQLFRYKVTYSTYQLHIHKTDRIPPRYLWNAILWSAEELQEVGYLKIEESSYLGLPSLKTLGDLYFKDYVQGKYGSTVKEFLASSAGIPTP